MAPSRNDEDEEAGGGARGTVYRFAGFALDMSTMALTRGGQGHRLEPKVREALLLLLEHPGEVVTHEEFADRVWRGRVVSGHSLATVINKLRGVIGAEAVATVHGYGYRFAEPVEVERSREHAPRLEVHLGDPLPGRPNWRALRPLGHGGFSDVWLYAHAKTGEERVVKFAPDSRGLRALRREVTVSRLLQSRAAVPQGYARILDWSFEAPPFFIELPHYGTNLLDWSQQDAQLAAMSGAQRLELMVELAERVDQAHGLGILHRDLKPSNIFLRTVGEQRLPIIADFGSGQLASDEVFDELDITRLGFSRDLFDTSGGSATGTPVYIAPEAWEGRALTVRADVYALGVILYQMLVGDLRQPMPADWQQHLDDPELIEDIAAATASDPAQRLASGADLARRLRQLPERRAARIERERLQQQAAVARAAQARARARRPWVIAATTALAMGLSTSLFYLAEARQQRAEAEKQLATASALSRFLQEGVIRAGDPHHGGSPSIPLRDAVRQAVPLFEASFEAGPEVEGALRHALAEMFSTLTELDEAERHWRRRLELLSREDALDSDAAVDARISLAGVLAHRGQWQEALAELDGADAALAGRGLNGGKLLDRAAYIRALVVYESGQWQRAAALSERFLAAHEPRHPAVEAQMRQLLGNAYLALSRPADALQATDALLAFVAREMGEEHIRHLYAQMLRAVALKALHRYDEAEAAFEALIERSSKRLGPDHKDTLTLRQELAVVLAASGRLERSAALLLDVYQRRQEVLGLQHRQTIGALQDYAVALKRMGRIAEARPHLERAFALKVEHLGEDHPETFLAEYNLADAMLDQGDLDAVAEHLASMRTRGTEVFPEGHEWHPRLLYLDGRLARARGETQRAAGLWRQALALLPDDGTGSDSFAVNLRAQLARIEDTRS